jgi:hypothetical protein
MNFRRVIQAATLLLFSAVMLFGYDEWDLPNLVTPTTVKPMALEAQFQHQFLGRIDGKNAADRVFGISDGADVRTKLRFIIWSTIQVYASYDNLQQFNYSRNEYVLGASYAHAIPFIHILAQADGRYYTNASFITFPQVRKNYYFVQLALQNEPLFDRVVVSANGGYDITNKRWGLGLGLDVKIIEMLDVVGTVFPVIDRSNSPVAGLPGSSTQDSPFLFGVKLTTAGHQFFLTLGSGSEIGEQHLMWGTGNTHLKFGFIVKRLFSFGGQN